MRLCVSCNSCWEQTTSHKPLACDVNPRIALADELDWQPPKAEYPRRIAIVGACVAGAYALVGAALTQFLPEPKPETEETNEPYSIS